MFIYTTVKILLTDISKAAVKSYWHTNFSPKIVIDKKPLNNIPKEHVEANRVMSAYGRVNRILPKLATIIPQKPSIIHRKLNIPFDPSYRLSASS